MDNAAICRIHRLEGDLAALAFCALGRTVSEIFEDCVAAFAVPFNVDGEPRAGVRLPPNHEAQQELEGIEGCTAPADQRAQVLSGDLDRHATILLADPHGPSESHQLEQPGHHGVRDRRGALPQCHPYAGFPSAQPQHPTGARIEDFDVHILPSNAQFV